MDIQKERAGAYASALQEIFYFCFNVSVYSLFTIHYSLFTGHHLFILVKSPLRLSPQMPHFNQTHQ